MQNNVNLKGAVLEGGNAVNLKANNLNIEDLKDISESTSSSWGIGYTYSFGTSKEETEANNKTANNGILGSLNEAAKTVNKINDSVSFGKAKINPLNFNVNLSKSNSSTITAVKGGINKVDNLNIGNLNFNGYDYGTNLQNIHTDTQNNREVLYSNNSGYDINIAPGQWLSSASGALSVLSTYTEIGGALAKSTVKTYNSLKDNGEVSFSEAYDQQKGIDEVQKNAREKNKNLLHDSEEYNKMVKEAGLVESNFNTIVYADGKDLSAGYSHKEKNEIGLDLLNGNGIVDAGSLENTYWHEVTHQGDKTNTTEADREKYATNMGNSAETLGSINNFLYGDGGLNDYTITNFYLNNRSALEYNNGYVSSLDKTLLENKAYMVSRNLGKEDGKIINFGDIHLVDSEKMLFAHQFIVITGSEKYLNNYIKEYNIENNLNLPVQAIEIKEPMVQNGIEKTATDTHYITLGGYNGSGNSQYKEGQDGLLIKNFNAEDDTKFLDAGKFYNYELTSKKQLSKDYTQQDYEKNIVESYVGYNKEADYTFVPELSKGYNSNSFAYSICYYGGGANCGYDLPRGTPGTQIIIPKAYFDINYINKNNKYN